MSAFYNHDRQTEGLQRLRDDRQANVRLAALLISLLLHGLIFWWGMNSARFAAPSQEKMQAIRVFLQPLELPKLTTPPRPSCGKPPRGTEPLKARPEAPPPNTATLAPQPVAPAPQPTPCPVVTAPEIPSSPPIAISMSPLPVAASTAVPLPTVGVITGASGKTNPAAGTDVVAGQSGLASPAATTAGENGSAGTGKKLYLQRLFAHIEAHKFYPPSARRRQLEGQVLVSFTIGNGGEVSNLKVAEGHPQLEEAALQTVRSALPLPIPAGEVNLPFSLSYHMDFRLR